jgi:ribosomal protein S6
MVVTTTLKKYEAMFLLNNAKATAETAQGVTIVSDLLKKHGAEIAKVGVWDERKLAYPIENQKRGTYVLAHFTLDPAHVGNVTHEVNINEDVMRALVTALEEEFPTFRTYAEMEALRPKRDPLVETRRRRDDELDEDDMGDRGEGRDHDR